MLMYHHRQQAGASFFESQDTPGKHAALLHIEYRRVPVSPSGASAADVVVLQSRWHRNKKSFPLVWPATLPHQCRISLSVCLLLGAGLRLIRLVLVPVKPHWQQGWATGGMAARPARLVVCHAFNIQNIVFKILIFQVTLANKP